MNRVGVAYYERRLKTEGAKGGRRGPDHANQLRKQRGRIFDSFTNQELMGVFKDV